MTQLGGDTYQGIMLGTAQLGSIYGVTNRSGCPSDAEAAKIIDLALRSGINHFDTARAYGNAENRLGKLLSATSYGRPKLVSKLPNLNALPENASIHDIYNAIDSSVFGSCMDLRTQQIDIEMFHSSADMHRWNGAALNRLCELQKQGVIGAIGASVYSPIDAIRCISDQRVTHLQIPFNLVDSRWLDGDFDQALKSRPDVHVHVRSVFLQGLLINSAKDWPDWLDQKEDVVFKISSLTKAFGRRNAVDLCLAYVRSFEWPKTLVLGVETAAQLEELISLFEEPKLNAEEVLMIQSVLKELPQRILIPSQW
jgi:spore coat polysaccharide biosynthesis protein SpsF